MTAHWMRLVPFVLGFVFLVLGILSLIAGESGTGTVQLVLAVGWVMGGLYKGRRRPA